MGRGKRVAPLLQNITWVRLVQQALLMRLIILLTKGVGGGPAPAPAWGVGSRAQGGTRAGEEMGLREKEGEGRDGGKRRLGGSPGAPSPVQAPTCLQTSFLLPNHTRCGAGWHGAGCQAPHHCTV